MKKIEIYIFLKYIEALLLLRMSLDCDFKTDKALMLMTEAELGEEPCSRCRWHEYINVHSCFCDIMFEELGVCDKCLQAKCNCLNETVEEVCLCDS